MKNYEKTQKASFDLIGRSSNLLERAADFVWRVLPVMLKLSITILSILAFQAFLVGAFDRIGISPKWSLISTSLIFILTFSGLIVWGGQKKESIETKLDEQTFNTEPICKILVIHRKN